MQTEALGRFRSPARKAQGFVSFHVEPVFLIWFLHQQRRERSDWLVPKLETGHRLHEPPAWLRCADKKIEQGLGEDQLQELNQ